MGSRIFFYFDTQHNGKAMHYRGWRGTWNATIISLLGNYRAGRRLGRPCLSAWREAIKVARMTFRSSRI